MADSLTKKQRLLKKELDEIAERIGVDYWNILDRERAARTTVLEVEEINALRNSVAHAFFPKNLRAYGSKKSVPKKNPPVLYKGQDVFTAAAGAKRFCDDAEDVWTFIVTKMKRKKASGKRAPLTTLTPVLS